MEKFAIAVHGGAGTISPGEMSPEKEREYKAALEAALEKGYSILKSGGSSLDAVVASVQSLEDCPLFNAGRGSVFTHEGTIEMDASLMEGKNLEAGAVASVKNTKNPILLAKEVMLHSGHVMMVGRGAEEFAKTRGLEFMPDEYFFTENRWQQLQKAKEEGVVQLDHSPGKKFGTVGCVALDQAGNLAAGTSTGGMTNKKFGRVGDTPILGAGTWADNQTCAVSCTGSGEYFIRGAVAHEISVLMKYAGLDLKAACEKTVLENLVKLGGEGGVIAVDGHGKIELIFNSEGMYRASRQGNAPPVISIYR